MHSPRSCSAGGSVRVGGEFPARADLVRSSRSKQPIPHSAWIACNCKVHDVCVPTLPQDEDSRARRSHHCVQRLQEVPGVLVSRLQACRLSSNISIKRSTMIPLSCKTGIAARHSTGAPFLVLKCPHIWSAFSSR